MKIRLVSEEPDDRRGRHRKDDWDTSVAGAAAVAYRAGTQKARLLAAYRNHPRGLTDEEAAREVGLQLTCYWKRCGELRQDGMIEPTGETRPGEAHVARIVCAITEAGWSS